LDRPLKGIGVRGDAIPLHGRFARGAPYPPRIQTDV